MKIAAQEGERSSKEELRTVEAMSQMEQLVYECLQHVHDSLDLNMALNRLLAFIGERFNCQRAFVFEKNVACRYDNTYEWCAPGVATQKALLQDVSDQGMDWWIDAFQHGHEVIIRDVENIREDHPIAYAVIHAHGVRSLVAAGLWENDRLVGFFGAEEPRPEDLDRLSVFLRLISYFVSAILCRRELTDRLKHMSYHDQLTGVWNLNAMRERTEQLEMADSMGVAYCDITALKQINDNLGHHAGDDAIQSCARMMSEVFGKEQVYRVGGDEFLALCPNMEQENFRVMVGALKLCVTQGDCPIAVGTMWTDQKPLNLNKAIAQADADMYDNKRAYYGQIDPLSGKSRDRRRSAGRSTDRPADRRMPVAQREEARADSPLVQYVRSNFFDGEALLKSIGEMGRSCFMYFGDMQTGIFYITDNLRDTFGFEKNVVPNFISAWEKRISNREDLQLFQRDILRLIQEKEDWHDLWYRVRDREGYSFWIHCRGRVLWDANRENPLFFSGCIVSQESDYVVDPCTNFPRESAALLKLDELLRDDKLGMVVGFSLNNFEDINEARGREDADELLREVATQLNEHFGHRVFFYRLDGLYFMAVAALVFRDEDLPRIIQDIVQAAYWRRGFVVRRPCSVSVFRQSDPDVRVTPQSILSTIMFTTSLAKHSPEEEEEMRIDVSNAMRLKKRRADLTLEINRSVLNGFSGFRIVVQPVVSAAADVVGGEALLRWTCKGKDVPPVQFIPLLEKNRLILSVGRWVFEEVARTCKRIVAYRPDFHLAFNVSYHQLADEGFPAFMAETLKRFELDGSHLVMELTETHFDETPEKFQRFVSSCREIGMKVALDDFGSGYSSLTLLLRYPADVVKLDRALLTESTHSEDKAMFIRTIVYACHQFGKHVCMEGVENDEDMDIIRQAQCDMIQGFYFYKPLEIQDLFRLLLSDDFDDPVPQPLQS